jgi:condensin complex subunit 1
VEKLCQRFKQTEQPRQWRDLALCLSLLPYTTEKAIKRLVDLVPLYQETLHEPTVYAYFEEILNKARLRRAVSLAERPCV